jgi:hypothetical protein
MMNSEVNDVIHCLPGAVVKVRVPRGPGAVEGKGQLLVVLVLLTPHPEGGEHFDLQQAEDGQNQISQVEADEEWSALRANAYDADQSPMRTVSVYACSGAGCVSPYAQRPHSLDNRAWDGTRTVW